MFSDRETLPVRQLRSLHLLVFLLIAGVCLGFSGCKKQSSSQQESASSQETPRGALELVFPYGSEKEKWIGDVTRDFNQQKIKTQSGKTIFVRAIPMGSGETIDKMLSGRCKPISSAPLPRPSSS